jgi:nitrite reductase/ring-hydroxylating ferredoxin subunit
VSALRPRIFRWQVATLAVLSLIVATLVFADLSKGSSGWVTATSARDLARKGVVLDEKHKVYLVQTAAGPIALNQYGDYEHGKVVYCESSGFFEGVNAGSKFDRLGHYFAGPAGGSLRRYPTRVEDGMVQIEPYEPLPRLGREESRRNVRQPAGAYCIPT